MKEKECVVEDIRNKSSHIFDIDHLTSSPLPVLFIAHMCHLLFFCNSFLFYTLRLFTN